MAEAKRNATAILKSSQPLASIPQDRKNNPAPTFFPQEYGNHTDVRYSRLVFEGDQGFTIRAVGKPFQFSVKDTDDQSLYRAKHREQIKKQPFYQLTVDGFLRGVGSNSCGPGPAKHHIIEADKPLAYSFMISLDKVGDKNV